MDLSIDQLQILLAHWGYLVVFLAMLLESAGVPLPGETLTLLGGYASGSGQLNVFGVVGAAFVGAVLGDNLGFLVGRRAGWHQIVRLGQLLRQSPEQMEQLRRGFLRHSGRSVFWGRFVALLRVLAGPMAGAVGMNYKRFVLCNLGGALLWSSSMVGLAWLGGRWIPIDRMLQGVLYFGFGALVLVLILLVVPALISEWQSRRLDGGSQDPGT